jgi:hypothetical protein
MIAPAWPIVLPGRRREAGDVGEHRLRDVLLHVAGGLLSSSSPPISPTSTITLRLRNGFEALEHVDERRPDDGIAAMPTIVELPRPSCVSSCPIW